MTIVNDDSWVVNKLEASLFDDTRVIIYDWHMFTVQATDVQLFEYIMRLLREWEKNQILKKDWRSFKVELKTNVFYWSVSQIKKALWRGSKFLIVS